MRLLLPEIKKDPYIKWTNKTKLQLVPQLLGYIFAIITISKAQSIFNGETEGKKILESKYLFTPHAAQIIAILRVLGISSDEKTEVKQIP